MVYIEENIWDFDLEKALGEISEQRRETALRIRHEQGRRQCVLAYLLLKKALREEYGITENPLFDFGEHGKPSIRNHPDIHFNLSHCSEAVACIVGNHSVGIDVETVKKRSEGVVRYTMNEEEIAEIEAAADPDVAFTRLWTRKEALMKMTGSGITNDLKEVLRNNHVEISTEVSRSRKYVLSVCSSR